MLMKKTINIWMQMLGFDKNDADRGVSRFLGRTGFVPESVCALLFSPDFVHLHRGMDEEYTLFPDNCAYRAVLRNTERERQEWTNFELRELVAELKKQGIKYYAGLMGAYTKDMFHHEWLTDHSEIRACKTSGRGDLMCLKRFKDGTYYEDFFAERLVQTLVDYDMAGVHLSDGFCPSGQIFKGDYSTDMVEQFVEYAKITLPDEIAATLGDDTKDAAKARQSYIWSEHRRGWIAFWEWRWTRFFKKVCDAVHAVGKEVWILGMYCSDPFETRYIYGFDTRAVMDAGVDCITANILPSSVYFEQPQFPYYFHRMHMDLPLLRAQVGEHKVLSMVSIHDASEEWSMIDHAPVRVERDVYTMTSFASLNAKGARQVADGVFICLGDGVERQKWDFIKKRLDIGFSTDTARPRSPLVVWSDTANENMIDEYISTRRTTPHKQSFEIFKAGTPFSGAVRSEFVSDTDTVLFVPNYDMLTQGEQKALADYKYPWVATVPMGYELGDIKPQAVFADKYSDYPMKVFACGLELGKEKRAEIEALLAVVDGKKGGAADPERFVHPPIEELPFAKLSDGFIRACALVLREAVYAQTGLSCAHPMMVQELEGGIERIYFYNKYDNAYINVVVDSEYTVESAEIVSDFPVLPVKFVDTEDKSGFFDYSKASGERKHFQIRIAPDGLTIVDIKRKK